MYSRNDDFYFKAEISSAYEGGRSVSAFRRRVLGQGYVR